MSAHPNKGGKGEHWVGNPKPVAPKQSDSWWTRPAVQHSRAAFQTAFKCEQQRIVGDPTFGGSKRVHDSGLDS